MADEKEPQKPKIVKMRTPGLSEVDSSQFQLVPLGKKGMEEGTEHSRDEREAGEQRSRHPKEPPSSPPKRKSAKSRQPKQDGQSGKRNKMVVPEQERNRSSSLFHSSADAEERRPVPSQTGKEQSQKKAASSKRGRALHQERRRKRKRARRGEWLRILFFFLAIGILLTVTLLYKRNDNALLTGYITNGSIENLARGQVYFLRKENTISTPYSGKVVANVNDGERVSAGAVIAYVVSSEMEEILTELKKVESRIAAAQKSSDKTLTLLSEDLSVIDKAIEETVLKMTAATMQGGLADFEAAQDELDSLFERRNDLLMNVDTADQYIRNLQAQRDVLQAKLSGNVHEIASEQSGVVSFSTDGKEGQSTEWIKNLENAGVPQVSVSFLREFDVNSSRSIGREVSSGTVIARVTSEIEYYMAVVVQEGAGHVRKGSEVTIKSNDRSFATKAEVVSVQQNDKECVAVLKSSAAMAGIAPLRKTDVEIVATYTEGMKVPLRSLTNWDAAGVTAQIALIRANYVEYVYVNVLDKNSEYAIINSKYGFDTENESLSVRLNDIYVVNPEQVVEGQVIES